MVIMRIKEKEKLFLQISQFSSLIPFRVTSGVFPTILKSIYIIFWGKWEREKKKEEEMKKKK
jgi:hypothetical protein